MEFKEQNISDIHKQLDKITTNMEDQARQGRKIHEVEKGLFSSLVQLGLSLLSYYIQLVKEIVKQQGPPKDGKGKSLKHKGNRSSSYFSVFGRLQIKRAKYYSCLEKTHYPLDAQLGLPRSSYSYLLSDWMSYGAVEMDFEQSVDHLQHILGHNLSGMQASRRTYALSDRVEPYYQHKDWAAPRGRHQQEGTHLSVGYDGKGIPIIGSQAESPATRLGKGQKRGVKKEATISLSSSFTARKRTAEQILDNLFCPPEPSKEKKVKQNAAQQHQWHEHKHTRAFLSNKQKAVSYGIDNLLKRDQTAQKPIIVLIDGDRALENAIKKAVRQKAVQDRVQAYVLDFIHLLEYVWKVANAHLGEKNPQREEWVKQQAKLLLESKHVQVIEQWQKMEQKNKHKPTQAYNLKRAITYLENHSHMVDYKTYLENGYPITTGAIESACGHFIKSRMERNAMHWSTQGAQKMLNMRAVKKNGDWSDYQKNFIQHEQNHLYRRAA
jgi:hypothetical protein